MNSISPQLKQEAFKAALKARNHAHAPYSKFQVGAALVDSKGNIYPGCNVENASFGATVCAERTALLSSVALQGKIDYQFIVVVCDTQPVTVPCALCLQVLSEFVSADFPVYLADLKAVQKEVSFGELLPMPFNTLDKQNEN